jgi:hypothetical protein
MKIRRVEAELFGRTDRQVDITKPVVACRNFANAPKTIVLKCYQGIYKFARLLIYQLVRSGTSCN